MGRWVFLLGGPLVWLAHFSGVYGIASVADVVAEASAPAARLAVGAFTLVCAAACAALAWLAFARKGPGVADETDAGLQGLWRKVAGGGAALALVAVLWQGLPALVGH